MQPNQMVEAIMHKGVIGCKPNTPLEEVVRVMADTNLHVIVVTGSSDEALGIISQLEVIPYYGRDLKGIKARDVMSSTVIAIPPNMLVTEAVKIMVEKKILHLVVSQRGDVGLKALGTLSSAEVIRNMRGSKWMWYFSPEP
jgi:CBS domain-containing protein